MASVTAIGFDVYGTLVDPLGIGDELRKFVGEDAERVAQLWRTTQLEYTWRRSLMGLYEPFSVCTAQALDLAARSLGHQIWIPRRRRRRCCKRIGNCPRFPTPCRA